MGIRHLREEGQFTYLGHPSRTLCGLLVQRDETTGEALLTNCLTCLDKIIQTTAQEAEALHARASALRNLQSALRDVQIDKKFS